nr:DegT/DnrJ/EryC1/StrS family aminotransferase [bacterium]
MNIDFFIHNINQDDISKACETMKSLFLTTGPVVAEFERKLALYLGVKEAVGLTSCTGAIHLALL